MTTGLTVGGFAPIANVDGTPMVDSSIDIHGNPFGVTSLHSTFDACGSLDSGTDWSGNCMMDWS